MNLPRLTIDVTAGSDAAHRNPGCVSIPARPCDDGQVAFTKVVLLVGAPFGKLSPGNSVARRLFTQTLCELTQIVDRPRRLVQSTSFTNCCVEV